MPRASDEQVERIARCISHLNRLTSQIARTSGQVDYEIDVELIAVEEAVDALREACDLEKVGEVENGTAPAGMAPQTGATAMNAELAANGIPVQEETGPAAGGETSANPGTPSVGIPAQPPAPGGADANPFTKG